MFLKIHFAVGMIWLSAARVAFADPRPIPVNFRSSPLTTTTGGTLTFDLPDPRGGWILAMISSGDGPAGVKTAEVHTASLRGISNVSRILKVVPSESVTVSTATDRVGLTSTGIADPATKLLIVARVTFPQDVHVSTPNGEILRLRITGPTTIRNGALLASAAVSEGEAIMLAGGHWPNRSPEEALTPTAERLRIFRDFPVIANPLGRAQSLVFRVTLLEDGSPKDVRCVLGNEYAPNVEIANTIRSWKFTAAAGSSNDAVTVTVLHLPNGRVTSNLSPGVKR